MGNELSIYDVALVIIVGTVVLILLSYFIIMFFYTYKSKYKEHQAEVVQIKLDFSQTLLQSQLEIQEQTLQQVSRELHDNLGISASLVKIHLTTLPLENPELLPVKVDETKDLVRQLITDIKALSVRLDGDRVGRVGLIKAIGTEIERINKTGQFTATLTQESGNPEIEPGKATILYRMIQEILNNAVKHSQAKNINVNVQTSDKNLTLAISDDGCGFDWETKKNSGGAGLFNLTNRANLIQAVLSFNSAPGNGTIVTIELPTN